MSVYGKITSVCGKTWLKRAGSRENTAEDLVVVWKNSFGRKPGTGVWYLTNVVRCRLGGDPSAPKVVSYSEIVASALRGPVISAKSKEEALLKYAATGDGRQVWSLAGGEVFDAGDLTWGQRVFELVAESV